MLRQESHTRNTTEDGATAPQFQHLGFRSDASADREQKTLEEKLRLSRNSHAVDGDGREHSEIVGSCEIEEIWGDRAELETLGKLMAEERGVLVRRT